tara:strand:- start:118 stop:417 length:300 start_codon:yes stop_codon:yes gene_type:complete
MDSEWLKIVAAIGGSLLAGKKKKKSGGTDIPQMSLADYAKFGISNKFFMPASRRVSRTSAPIGKYTTADKNSFLSDYASLVNRQSRSFKKNYMKQFRTG